MLMSPFNARRINACYFIKDIRNLGYDKTQIGSLRKQPTQNCYASIFHMQTNTRHFKIRDIKI